MNSTGAMPKKINMSHFFYLGQTAEDLEMFTNIWLSSIGIIKGTAVSKLCQFRSLHDDVTQLYTWL